MSNNYSLPIFNETPEFEEEVYMSNHFMCHNEGSCCGDCEDCDYDGDCGLCENDGTGLCETCIRRSYME